MTSPSARLRTLIEANRAMMPTMEKDLTRDAVTCHAALMKWFYEHKESLADLIEAAEMYTANPLRRMASDGNYWEKIVAALNRLEEAPR